LYPANSVNAAGRNAKSNLPILHVTPT
jgi:hypothetical protein